MKLKPITAIVALLLVVVLVTISGCTSSNNGGTATSTNTTLTITTSDATPAVNKPITLSGTLTANGTPLAGKTVKLISKPNGGQWSTVNTTTTAANGSYAVTRSESAQGTYAYQPVFDGDATHAPSDGWIIFTVGTPEMSAISIQSTNLAPAVNQSFAIYGTLLDASGAPLAGQQISLGVIYTSPDPIAHMTTTTAANGSYAFTRSESAQGTYIYRVDFNSNPNYAEIQATVTMDVGNPIKTTLEPISITNSNPGVNQPFTISGYLTDINGKGVAGREILADVRLPTNQWVDRGTTTTDANGHYAMTFSEQTQGQYRYELMFYGDGTYATVVNGIEVPIGTLQPSKLSISTSVTNPGAGKPYTLSGTLTDANGTPLSGREIDLYLDVSGQSAQQPDILQNAYTDQNGHYSFAVNGSASGTYTYYVDFLGDQTYTTSNAQISVTVGST